MLEAYLSSVVIAVTGTLITQPKHVPKPLRRTMLPSPPPAPKILLPGCRPLPISGPTVFRARARKTMCSAMAGRRR